MGRWIPRALVSVLAVAALWSVFAGSTVSAYSDTVTTGTNTFSATTDWTAPTVSAYAIGRTTAYETGTIKQGASYYVYANVTDAGNPSSGIGSVAANVTTLTTGTTSLALIAGSYTAGGVSYNYRSAAKSANSTLSAGTYTSSVTATDNQSNATSQNISTTVDNTAPAGSDVQSTNASGGTVGKVEQGDALTLTFNATMDPFSILSGWTGAATTGIQANLYDGGSSSDYIRIYTSTSSPALVPLGTITLTNNNYLKTGTGTSVTFGASGASVPSTMTRSGSTITITLGSASGATPIATGSAKMTWVPSATATDIAGNACSTATVTQSGTSHLNF